MNSALGFWNALPNDKAASAILPCCGSRRWASMLANGRPFSEGASLLRRADEIWWGLDESDWVEAFATHPRIGERSAPKSASKQSAAWSAEEQNGAANGDASLLAAIAEGNRLYEQRFGRTYVVCAAGKSAHELLAMLHNRLGNDEITEMREAAEQQRQITALRLQKWLAQ